MSKPYMITYDLDKPGQRYTEIQDTIKEGISNGRWCHFWDSTYLVRSELSATQIIKELESNIDGNDRFFIVEASKESYAGWLSNDEWEYVNKNIFY